MLIALLGFLMTAFVLFSLISGFLVYVYVCFVFSLAASLGVITWLVLSHMATLLFPMAVSNTGYMFVIQTSFTVISVLLSATVGLAALRVTYDKLCQK